MNKKTAIIISIILLLLIGAGVIYWYLFFHGPGNEITPLVVGTNNTTGFKPFGTSPSGTGNSGAGGSGNNNQNPITTINPSNPIPSLRLLSNTPIGGYGASTTASTTAVRWIDRGRGNIIEAKENSTTFVTLSNTILPRMYESVWNKNLTALIGFILSSDSNIPTAVYAQLTPQGLPTPSPTPSKAKPTPLPSKKTSLTSATSSSKTAIATTSPIQTTIQPSSVADLTAYSLKGKNLPDNTIGFAVSPKGDKIFMLVKENDSSTGYIANFDGSSVVKIFTTPLTQVNVAWPEETTIAITTKGSFSQFGFLYFVNTKTGAWKKILGPIKGLSAIVSHDAKYVLESETSQEQMLTTNIFAVGTSTAVNTSIRTIADKCAWGNFYKEMVYCAIPSELNAATYPDDWYRGNVSFNDQLWQINAKTNETHLVSSIADQTNQIIDGFNLGLDSKDNYLFFMNKIDLSFWSFNLTAKH